MTIARVLLIGAGCAAAVFGAYEATQALSMTQLLWLVVWLAAVIVVHDAVLVPVLSVARARVRRAGRAWPAEVTALIEAGFMIFGALALFVVPELWAQGRGNPNPTILQGDYGMRLLVVAILVALAVLIPARIMIRRARR